MSRQEGSWSQWCRAHGSAYVSGDSISGLATGLRGEGGAHAARLDSGLLPISNSLLRQGVPGCYRAGSMATRFLVRAATRNKRFWARGQGTALAT